MCVCKGQSLLPYLFAGDVDFRSTEDQLVFVPSEQSQRRCGCIELLQDSAVEDAEEFTVELRSINPNVNLMLSTGLVTLEDDDDGNHNCVWGKTLIKLYTQ